MKPNLVYLLAMMLPGLLLTPVNAQEGQVNIRPDTASVTVATDNGAVEIQRIQNKEHRITGEFAKTSRACPPFCIQPMHPVDGTTAIGELELLDLLQDENAVVVDARTIEWYLEETIPGSVHISYVEIADRLDELGCTKKPESAWVCDNAKPVALFCNGPWCGQSPIAIQAMVREGYPVERIHYYRGGMQSWKILGLTTTPGDF